MYRGNESWLLSIAKTGRIRLVVADAVAAEAQRVIAWKFPEYATTVRTFLVTADFERVPLPDADTLREASSLVRDSDDCPIVASALASKPDYLVTGDKDLLTPAIADRMHACRCREYLGRLMRRGPR